MAEKIEFWFEFASTYSYVAAEEIEEKAAAARIEVVWRPFLLGPIFAEQGWRDSPFNLFPAKGAYMWRDIERICQSKGIAWRTAKRLSAQRPFGRSNRNRVGWGGETCCFRSGRLSRQFFR